MTNFDPNALISFIVFLAFIGFTVKRLFTYLHAFQQEEYDGERFLSWIIRHRVFDKKFSFVALLAGIGWFFLDSDLQFIAHLAIVLAFAFVSYFEPDPRKDSKKKLAFTARARRIFFSALFLCIPAGVAAQLIGIPLLWVLAVQLIPLLLVAANAFLQPFENFNQGRFWKEANQKLVTLSPTVIGVTGSYGKTSVKHILGHILSSVAPTLITPGSVNTPMGIARIVREQLDDTVRYFVVEMGAYGRGSIDRLCRLAPPDFGIISAIGHAHFERFKTLETVAETKFELAQAALRRDGKVIVHEKTLRFPYTQDIRDNHEASFIVTGSAVTNQLIIEKNVQTLDGLEIDLRWKDTFYSLNVPLFGLHHTDNIGLAFATACTMGIEPQIVINALKTVPQVPHRLEVKKLNKGYLIDDAYNSNPLGFRSALDLLFLVGKKRRKILITPGMVELGGAHDEIHYQIGGLAAESCDICIAIQPKRIKTFVQGFKEKSRSNQMLLEMESFAQAQEWLDDNIQDKDLVLIENDLPDIYERIPKL